MTLPVTITTVLLLICCSVEFLARKRLMLYLIRNLFIRLTMERLNSGFRRLKKYFLHSPWPPSQVPKWKFQEETSQVPSKYQFHYDFSFVSFLRNAKPKVSVQLYCRPTVHVQCSAVQCVRHFTSAANYVHGMDDTLTLRRRMHGGTGQIWRYILWTWRSTSMLWTWVIDQKLPF